MAYVWLKTLHVASVLIFVSGLVAQTLAVANLVNATRPMIEAMERWDRQVTTPALLATWLFGVTIAVMGAFVTSGWLLAKLAIVVGLSALHGIQAGQLRRSLNGQVATVRTAPARMPMLLLAALATIAVLVVAKPF